jgi:hypothetical protein
MSVVVEDVEVGHIFQMQVHTSPRLSHWQSCQNLQMPEAMMEINVVWETLVCVRKNRGCVLVESIDNSIGRLGEQRWISPSTVIRQIPND